MKRTGKTGATTRLTGIALAVAALAAFVPGWSEAGEKKPPQKQLPAPKEKAWNLSGRASRHQKIDAWVRATQPADSPEAQKESGLPIIPGARGFGMNTVAGSGRHLTPPKTTVYKVTNLNDSGPGSLREALAAEGPRTVVFEVAGTIKLDGNLGIRHPYVTIAGQTAPSPGITLRGAGIRGLPREALLQHVRVRVGDEPNEKVGYSERDALCAGYGVSNVVVDHCSLSWATDELVECRASNLTFSNCIFAEPLECGSHWKGGHAYGMLVSDDYFSRMSTNNRYPVADRVAIIGNLFAHNMMRNPVLDGARAVVVNNLIYDYRNAGISIHGNHWKKRAAQVSVIGNAIIEGEETFGTSRAITVCASSIYPENRIYLSDNIVGGRTSRAPWSRTKAIDGIYDKRPMPGEFKARKPPVVVEGLAIKPSREVEAWVLANAGARPSDRDAVDKRVVNTVRNRTGRIIASQKDVGGWPKLAENRRKLTIPENPNGDDDGDGYTNLEEWLHGYAAQVESVEPASDIDLKPAALKVAAAEQGMVTRTLTIANRGKSELKWDILTQVADTAKAGKVKRELALPGELSAVSDIAFDGTNLWVSEGAQSSLLYKVDPTSGRLRGLVDMHEYCSEPLGLAWDEVGNMLWIVDRKGWMIHIVHPLWGDKEYSFNSKHNHSHLSKHNSGIAYGDGAVWVIRSMNSVDCNTITKLRPVSCGPMGGRIPIDPAAFDREDTKVYAYNLAYLNGALWIAPRMGAGLIYKLDPRDGRVMRSFQGPGGDAQMGIAAGGDGCLWLATQHGRAEQRKAFLVDTGEVAGEGRLAAQPRSGVVPPGGSAKVTVTIDASKIEAGRHAAAIHLHSNDPDEPHLEIPLILKKKGE